MGEFHFGDKLRALRKSRKLSQAEVAFHLNISQASYSRLENQKEVASPEMCQRIANFYKIDVEELDGTFEDPEFKAMKLVGGRRLLRKIKNALHTLGGIFIVLGVIAALANLVYLAILGFCKSMGLAPLTAEVWGTLAGIVVLIYIYYWIKKLRKSG
ncbi:Helix-turn-helix domain protein [compost metagenome]